MTAAVATIGAFDGVHLGHRWLLEQVVDRAHHLGVRSAAITFDPHPDLVLWPERHLTYLCDRDEKESLIRSIGLDDVTVFEFTREFSMLLPEEFIDMVEAKHPLRELWIGPDFAMGRGRSGTVAALAELGRQKGFAVHMVPPLRLEGETVSSSSIRSLLAEGNVPHTNQLLGREFSVCGTVVSGHKRGRELGFPTANLSLPSQRALPADGVYVATAEWSGRTARAVVNLGGRPTFDDSSRLLEAHLIDEDVDVYGQWMCVRFLRRLRGILKFGSIEALKLQIAADREAAVTEFSRGG
jgi:riboflavin kinase/FMN adenylyltransferase